MIDITYVPALTEDEERSHDLFHQTVERAAQEYGLDNPAQFYALQKFAADIWHAAFRRAEEVLAESDD